MNVDPEHFTKVQFGPPEPKVVGSSPAGRSKWLITKYLHLTVAKP